MAEKLSLGSERPVTRLFWVCMTTLALSFLAAGTTLYLSILDNRQTTQDRKWDTVFQDQVRLAERLHLKAEIAHLTRSQEILTDLSADLLAFDQGRDRIESLLAETPEAVETEERARLLQSMADLSNSVTALISPAAASDVAAWAPTQRDEVIEALVLASQGLERARQDSSAIFLRTVAIVVALVLALLLFELVFALQPSTAKLRKRLMHLEIRNRAKRPERIQSRPGAGALSEQVELQDALVASEALRQETAALGFMVAHDMKSPLNTAKLLLSEIEISVAEKDAAETDELLQTLGESVDRMSELIDDTLSYSWASNAELSSATVDMERCLDAVISDLKAEIQRDRAQITLGPLDTIVGDPVQVRLLVQNLLSNALKFQPTGNSPRIDVSCTASTPGGPTVLRIEDNGIGMAKEHLDAIFKPFKRLNLHESYSGSGLGLATCQRIAHNHNGEISVTSVVGKGTCFEVSFQASAVPMTFAKGQRAA